MAFLQPGLGQVRSDGLPFPANLVREPVTHGPDLGIALTPFAIAANPGHFGSDRKLISLTGLTEVTRAFFTSVSPQKVLTPVIGPDLDIIEVAEKLRSIGFQGTLIGLGAALVSATLVEREVRAVCPKLTVRVYG